MLNLRNWNTSSIFLRMRFSIVVTSSWPCVRFSFKSFYSSPEPVGCLFMHQVEIDAFGERRSSHVRFREDKAISVAHLIFSQLNFITASLGTKVGLQSQLSICSSIQNGRGTTFRNPAALLALQKKKIYSSRAHTAASNCEKKGAPHRVKGTSFILTTCLIQHER